MPRLSLRWLPLFAAVGLAPLAGCDPEEIHSYDVPRPAVSLTETKVKLLAAIFDVGDKDQWYFKLVGPKDDVNKHGDDFVEFIKSVRFQDKGDKPVTWKIPRDGWVEGEPKQMGYATFYPEPKNRALELTIFRFDHRSPLLDNVNRWCDRDLARPHLRKPDVNPDNESQDFVKTIHAGDVRGVLVKLEGRGPKKPKGSPMGKGRDAHDDDDDPPPVHNDRPAKPPLTYRVPQGWVETKPGAMVAVAFAVRDGKRTAEVQISSLGANFGDPLSNQNRWRAQVGLQPVKAIDPKPASIEVNGVASDYFDFVGPQGKRMLLVVSKRGQQSWFFKLLGDAQVVADNRDKFESFVKSVKYSGAAE